MNKPPKYPLQLLRWFCHTDLIEDVEGDLMELFEQRAIQLGLSKAKWRLVWDILLLIRPGIIRPIEGVYNLNQFGMFKNYFKTGIRNILKYKAFSFINIFGLAVSMSVCLLIMLMLAGQKKSDQFHEKKDRIYRILSISNESTFPYATTPFPLSSTLQSDHSSIEKATQLVNGVGGDATYDEKTLEIRGFFADTNFFKVFNYQLEKGNLHSALTTPYSIVITHSFAKRLFNDEDPLGKTIAFTDRGLDHLGIGGKEKPPVDWGLYTITGVIANKNYKSHLKFDVLVSAVSMNLLYQTKKIPDLRDRWKSFFNTYTYILLNPENSIEDLTSTLEQVVSTKYAAIHSGEKITKMEAQKLLSISPGPFTSKPISLRMPIEAYYILSLLAIVVMLLACLNYINLSIARALTRAKEIGVRKVIGGSRKDIIFQFLSESIITALAALIMAIGLLMIVKSAFTNLWLNNYLHFDLQASSYIYIAFLGFAVGIGLLAGIYPALRMSNYKPITVLRSAKIEKKGKLSIQKILNVSQFSVSLFFVVTSILIFNQLNHFLKFDYGFTTENLINIELQSNDYQIITNEFKTISGVTKISACSFIPASGGGDGIQLTKQNQEEFLRFNLLSVDEYFVENLKLNLIVGRNLSEAEIESKQSIIINTASVKYLGYDAPIEAIGTTLEGTQNNTFKIVGVVEDFQFKSLFEYNRNAPLVLRNQPEKFRHINLSISSTNQLATIEQLEEKWQNIDPIHPFKYQYMDSQLASMNALFNDIVSIVGFITFLAIIISCLGLLGMSIYTTERRTKEIGIRKVLGARAGDIAFLISKEFLVLIVISIVVAAPLSYFANNLWLQNFPNRVQFGLGTVLLGAFLLLTLGLLTISSQTIKAAMRNPVASLKDE